MGEPWICPRCQRVWGPLTPACAPCNAVIATGNERPREPKRPPEPEVAEAEEEPVHGEDACREVVQPRLLYPYKEARQLLGDVAVSTFAGWIASGLLKPVRIGPRRAFIKHEDIVRLQAEGSPVAPKAATGAKKRGRPKKA